MQWAAAAVWLVFFLGGAGIPALAWQTPSAVDALLEKARGEENAGTYVSAESTYRQALALAPGNLEILKRLGILEQTELKFDDSIGMFKQVLTGDPNYKGVNFFLGLSYFGKNEFLAAIDWFERELKTPKPHPRTQYYLGLALQSAGRSDEAIFHLNQALAQDPKDADSLYELARLHKNASLHSIEALKALDPESFQLHALMGEVYAEQERYSDAIVEYQKALAKRPEAPGMQFLIGVAYWAQRQMEPAEKAFKEAYRENPGDAMTNLYLGDIAVRYQRFSEALPFLMTAKEAQPEMPQLHVLLGQCYQSQKELQKAKTEFQAAIAADPAAPQPHYLLARVYRELHEAQASANELAKYDQLSKLEKEKTSPRTPQN
ncbi:MAG TPA: tetratricopeptide repeat protein [Candidatus Acidoferrum sp.]|nr:tetratricopeptide repeat protein [Candidatus Acidoferrum sp.]